MDIHMSGADTQAALALYEEVIRARFELEKEIEELEALASSEEGSERGKPIEPPPKKTSRRCCGWPTIT